MFLDAARGGVWNWFANPERMQGMRDYMAPRTAFFGQFFRNANNAGVRKAVILAAGLEARAWRLPWLGGSAVYELGQPKTFRC